MNKISQKNVFVSQVHVRLRAILSYKVARYVSHVGCNDEYKHCWLHAFMRVCIAFVTHYIISLSVMFDRTNSLKLHHCQAVASPKSATKHIWKNIKCHLIQTAPEYIQTSEKSMLDVSKCVLTKGRKKIIHLMAVPLSPLHFLFYSLLVFTLLK